MPLGQRQVGQKAVNCNRILASGTLCRKATGVATSCSDSCKLQWNLSYRDSVLRPLGPRQAAQIAANYNRILASGGPS